MANFKVQGHWDNKRFLGLTCLRSSFGEEASRVGSAEKKDASLAPCRVGLSQNHDRPYREIRFGS